MEQIEANDCNILSWLIEEVKYKFEWKFHLTQQSSQLDWLTTCCTKEN
ncbi:hypothetical protein ACQVPR_30085 [Bacillus cereus]